MMTVYAINKRTKEHRVATDCDYDEYRTMSMERPSFVSSRPGWHIVQADGGGWIPWSGGECPLPYGARFDVETREGGRLYNESACDSRVWQHGFGGGDIIAYRPILSDDEGEKSEWNGEGLPPVGCEVEYDNHSGQCAPSVGEVIKVVGGGTVVLLELPGDDWDYTSIDLVRPIRSDEDRAVEEMICSSVDYSACTKEEQDAVAATCRALYRAGYRKQ